MRSSEGMGPIVIRFQVFEREFIRAIREIHWRTKWSLFDLSVSLTVIAGCIWAWLTFGVSVLSILCFLAALLYLMIGSWILSDQPRKMFKQQPEFQHPHAVWFSDEVVIVRVNGREQWHDWTHYQEAIETREFFYLKYAKNNT
jgi:hypothetical protein